MKIGFVGSQGCGKTTSAYKLAAELKRMGNDVYVLSEVARSCPFKLNEQATQKTQMWIFGKQLTREQSSKGDILISDRTLMDSFCYGIRACPEFFKPLTPFMKEYLKTYDYIFYLEPNDNYLLDDGIRSTNKDFRNEIDKIISKYLVELDVKHITVNSGDVETMLKKIYGVKE